MQINPSFPENCQGMDTFAKTKDGKHFSVYADIWEDEYRLGAYQYYSEPQETGFSFPLYFSFGQLLKLAEETLLVLAHRNPLAVIRTLRLVLEKCEERLREKNKAH